MIQLPVFHVNGDDPEAVVWVARLAMQYRQLFKKDVVIDLVCYRRHGHNEMDEPDFTQPVMYRAIKQRSTVRVLYAQQLVNEGAISQIKLKIFIRFSSSFTKRIHLISDL